MILNDVNLENITFITNSNGIELFYSDMIEGKRIGSMKCLHLFIFKYQSTLPVDEGFPCYIANASCSKLIGDEISIILNKFGYSFKNADGNQYIPANINILYHLHLESGEIVLDVVCSQVEYNL